jgi:hypothetical protein
MNEKNDMYKQKRDEVKTEINSFRLKKDPTVFKKSEDERNILKLQKKEYRLSVGTKAHTSKRDSFISAFVAAEVPNWNVKFVML